jgi:hypothetical protein
MNALSTFFRIQFLPCLLFLGMLSFTSCDDDDDDDSPASTATPITIEFGASYQVLDGSTLSQGTPPVLSGDSVSIRVAYSGCTDNHEFEFHTRILSDSRAEIWLEKTTEDQACGAFYFFDEVHRVPFSVLERDEIYLVGPNFYSFRLR